MVFVTLDEKISKIGLTWATWVCEYVHKKVESRMSKVYTQLCINYSSSSETILMYNSVQNTVQCTRCQSRKKCTNKHKRSVICILCNICTVLLALAIVKIRPGTWNKLECTVYCEPSQGFPHMYIVSYKFIAPSWKNDA